VLDPTNACMMHPGPPGPTSVTKPYSRSNRATERVLVVLGALIGSLAAVYVCSSAGLRFWHAMRPTQVFIAFARPLPPRGWTCTSARVPGQTVSFISDK